MMKQKTLQTQYNLIKEGKGNKEVFLKEAKRIFPNYIPNAATFDQAEVILSQKSIISENIWGVATGKDEKPDWFAIFNDNMDAINEEAKAEEKKASKEVTDLEEKNFDYKDKKNIDNVYGEQFLKGYYCEMKNPKNEEKTVEELKSIVAKNLAKDQLHYVKAGQFGEEGVGYTDELPGLKASKSDQMEKVKLQEAKKSKKDTIESKLAEIDKASNVVALEAKINAIAEMIESKSQRLEMVNEDSDLAEMMDKAKIKAIQKEIKELEKRKSKMEKLYEKSCGKKYQQQEIVDETQIEETEITEEKGEFEVGEKVTYLGHPGEITSAKKDTMDRWEYSVSYDKGYGKTKVSNILNKGGEIKKA